jgi:hypothetical protein
MTKESPLTGKVSGLNVCRSETRMLALGAVTLTKANITCVYYNPF